MNLEISFELADAIMSVRHYQRMYNFYHKRYDEVFEFCTADMRTKQGRAYKKAYKEYVCASDDLRNSKLWLANLLVDVAPIDSELHEHNEQIVLNDPVLNQIIDEAIEAS